jgi:hypothetical protein
VTAVRRHPQALFEGRRESSQRDATPGRPLPRTLAATPLLETTALRVLRSPRSCTRGTATKDSNRAQSATRPVTQQAGRYQAGEAGSGAVAGRAEDSEEVGDDAELVSRNFPGYLQDVALVHHHMPVAYGNTVLFEERALNAIRVSRQEHLIRR